MPQGVSSVQGEGRKALPAHVSTCTTVSPSPAHKWPKSTMYVAPQAAVQQFLCCHSMTMAQVCPGEGLQFDCPDSSM